MFTKKAGWAAVAVLVAATGAAYAGCTSVYEEAYKPLEGGSGATGGTGGATTTTTVTCTSECCAPKDCPDGPCATGTCTLGKCGFDNLADGAEALEQILGNCKVELCDGEGGPKNNLEPAGTPCTVMNGKWCSATGQCVECNNTNDCESRDFVCSSQVCVPAMCTDMATNGTETDVDCGGACLPCEDGKDCLMEGDCQSQVCANNTCQVPTCDDGKKNGPEGGIDCGVACPNKDKCGPNEGCDQDADCAGGQCTGMDGMCTPNCMDGVQNNQEVGVDCGGGTCPGCPIGGPCAGSDTDCVMGSYCATNICTAKKPPGVTCTDTKECSTGVCDSTDKVCCDKMCSGKCQSCKIGETGGTCLDVPAGTDPDGECNASAVCNGSGACKKPTGATCNNPGDCANGLCTDGVCCNVPCDQPCLACNLGAPGTCVLVPKGMEDPGTCDGTNEACGDFGQACVQSIVGKKFGETCTAAIECFSGFCRGAKCKLATGAPCTDATKDNCASYHCVNNLCAACTTNADCPGTSCTAANFCSYLLGHPCNADPQCFSGTCTSGTCQ